MAASDGKGGQVVKPKTVVYDLFLKLVKQKNPSTDELDRLRRLIVSTPDAWELAIIPMRLSSQQTIIKKMGHGATGALMLA